MWLRNSQHFGSKRVFFLCKGLKIIWAADWHSAGLASCSPVVVSLHRQRWIAVIFPLAVDCGSRRLRPGLLTETFFAVACFVSNPSCLYTVASYRLRSVVVSRAGLRTPNRAATVAISCFLAGRPRAETVLPLEMTVRRGGREAEERAATTALPGLCPPKARWVDQENTHSSYGCSVLTVTLVVLAMDSVNISVRYIRRAVGMRKWLSCQRPTGTNAWCGGLNPPTSTWPERTNVADSSPAFYRSVTLWL